MLSKTSHLTEQVHWCSTGMHGFVFLRYFCAETDNVDRRCHTHPNNYAQVEEEQVLAAHAALMRGGTNAWQPLNFRAAALMEGVEGMGSAGGDREVQQALEQLLIANRNVSRPLSPVPYYRKAKTCLSRIRDTCSMQYRCMANTRHRGAASLFVPPILITLFSGREKYRYAYSIRIDNTM